jgi:hypothetical protein
MKPVFVHGHQIVRIVKDGAATGYRCELCGQQRDNAATFEMFDCRPQENAAQERSVA